MMPDGEVIRRTRGRRRTWSEKQLRMPTIRLLHHVIGLTQRWFTRAVVVSSEGRRS